MQDSGTVPGSFVSYHMDVDGSNAYRTAPAIWYGSRTPLETDGTNNFRVPFKNLPAGDHAANLQAINFGGSDVEIAGFWIAVLFASSSQAEVWDQRHNHQAVSASTWTTIAQITTPSAPNSHILLSSYVMAVNGGAVDFRYLAGSTQLRSYRMNLHSSRDGGIFNYFWKNAPGSTVVKLQARGASTVELTEFIGQTVRAYTIYEGVRTTPITIPNDNSLHLIAQSPGTYLNQATQPNVDAAGLQDTSAWGFAHTEMEMSGSTEALLWLRLFQGSSSTPVFHDMGVMGHSPDQYRDQYRQASDWSNVGISPSDPYRVEQALQGLCPSGPSITVSKSLFQVLVIPRLGSHVCTQGFHQPNCPYVCNIGNVPMVSGPSRTVCN